MLGTSPNRYARPRSVPVVLRRSPRATSGNGTAQDLLQRVPTMQTTIRATTAAITAALWTGMTGAQTPPMPPLKTFHLEVSLVEAGRPAATIVTGPGAEALALGRELADRVEAATGAQLPCVEGSED